MFYKTVDQIFPKIIDVFDVPMFILYLLHEEDLIIVETINVMQLDDPAPSTSKLWLLLVDDM